MEVQQDDWHKNGFRRARALLTRRVFEERQREKVQQQACSSTISVEPDSCGISRARSFWTVTMGSANGGGADGMRDER